MDNARKTDWTRSRFLHLAEKATRQEWARQSPLAWILQYQPRIRLPGKGLLPFEPYWAQQQVLLEDGNRHLNKGRQMGFTTVFAIEALWAFIYRPAAEIIVLSKSEKEAKKFLDKFYVAYHSIKDEDPNCPRLTAENRFDAAGTNGATINVLTSSKGAGRSFSATDLYFDEMAHTVYADDIYQAAMPTIAVTNGRVTLFSTPKGRNNKFAEVGEDPKEHGYAPFTFEWWFSPMYNAYYEDFMAAWLAGDKDGAARVVEEARKKPSFKKLRQSFKGSELAFKQEFEAAYDASTNSVFSVTQLRSIFKPATQVDLTHDEWNRFTDECWTSDPIEGHQYYSSTDFGRKRDANVTVTFDISEWPHRMVEYKRIPPGTTDWKLIELAVRETHDKFKSEMVHDVTGIGDVIGDLLSDISDGLHLSNNARSGVKYNIIENLRRAADQEAIVMPKLKQLYKEFKKYEWDDSYLEQDSVLAVAMAVYQFYRPDDTWVGVDTETSYVGA